jgi:hypothetical protein
MTVIYDMSIDRADKPWIGDRRLTEFPSESQGLLSSVQTVSRQSVESGGRSENHWQTKLPPARPGWSASRRCRRPASGMVPLERGGSTPS